jgi:hypothetical protein
MTIYKIYKYKLKLGLTGDKNIFYTSAAIES